MNVGTYWVVYMLFPCLFISDLTQFELDPVKIHPEVVVVFTGKVGHLTKQGLMTSLIVEIFIHGHTISWWKKLIVFIKENHSED